MRYSDRWQATMCGQSFSGLLMAGPGNFPGFYKGTVASLKEGFSSHRKRPWLPCAPPNMSLHMLLFVSHMCLIICRLIKQTSRHSTGLSSLCWNAFSQQRLADAGQHKNIKLGHAVCVLGKKRARSSTQQKHTRSKEQSHEVGWQSCPSLLLTSIMPTHELMQLDLHTH